MRTLAGGERCNDLEYLREDGVWERLGPRAISVSAYLRPAPHVWEKIPPSYRRCTSCGRVEVHAAA